MNIVTYSYARKNFRSVLDDVVNNCEPCCVVSKGNQVVMMSKADYDTLVETRHVERQLKSRGDK